jgi:hypothetical protein
MYNIVNDRPQSFGDYVRELSAKARLELGWTPTPQ